MKYLFIEDAVDAVRARMDELAERDSDMYTIVADDRNLSNTIEKLLPEAIETVQLSSPASLLEGIKYQTDELTYSSDNNTSVEIEKKDTPILRLVSLQGSNSDIALFYANSESSILGRLQKNKYLCGTNKAPVLVELSVGAEHLPIYRYFGRKPGTQTESFTMVYIPYEETPNTGKDGRLYYQVCTELYNSIISYLTGLVLMVYGEAEKANFYFGKSKSGLE